MFYLLLFNFYKVYILLQFFMYAYDTCVGVYGDGSVCYLHDDDGDDDGVFILSIQ